LHLRAYVLPTATLAWRTEARGRVGDGQHPPTGAARSAPPFFEHDDLRHAAVQLTQGRLTSTTTPWANNAAAVTLPTAFWWRVNISRPGFLLAIVILPSLQRSRAHRQLAHRPSRDRQLPRTHFRCAAMAPGHVLCATTECHGAMEHWRLGLPSNFDPWGQCARAFLIPQDWIECDSEATVRHRAQSVLERKPGRAVINSCGVGLWGGGGRGALAWPLSTGGGLLRPGPCLYRQRHLSGELYAALNEVAAAPWRCGPRVECGPRLTRRPPRALLSGARFSRLPSAVLPPGLHLRLDPRSRSCRPSGGSPWSRVGRQRGAVTGGSARRAMPGRAVSGGIIACELLPTLPRLSSALLVFTWPADRDDRHPAAHAEPLAGESAPRTRFF